MRNTLTIFKRELKSYFDSPIGYIFLIVFWLISIGIYMIPFFRNPSADMNSFFGLLPFYLCVFIPSVTMRLWAEERKLNTFEMLQTFPMTSTQIVLGKYFASVVFYCIALAGTLTIPIMLAILGDPDGGVLFSSYIGAFMLGAFFLAMGLLISGFCRDQIIAYVVSLLGLLLVYLLGTDALKFLIPFSDTLKDLLGVTVHYEEFSKGVIDIIHILYFVVWISLFLFLNGFFLESRSRKGAAWIFTAAAALCILIGLSFNWIISTTSLGRFDMTEDELYTLSPGSIQILNNLDAPVKATLYITPKEEMPEEIKDLERDVLAKLDELKVESGGKLKVNSVHLSTQKLIEAREEQRQKEIAKLMGEEKEEAEEKEKKEKEIEEKLFDKGIAPFNVGVQREGGQQMSQWVYSSIAIEYKEKDPEIISQVSPYIMDRLEYELISRIYRLTQEKKPVVALVAPKSTIPDYLIKLYMQMGRPVPPQQDPYSELETYLSGDFDVKRVELTKESGLPGEYNILMVIAPENLEKRQLWEINKAVVEGKNTVIAANPYRFRYKLKGRTPHIEMSEFKSNLDTILDTYGVSISDNVLMSSHWEMIGTRIEGFPLPTQIESPVNIIINSDNINHESAVTNRLEQLFYMWGSALDIDRDKVKENKLTVTELITTGKNAWEEKPEVFKADTILNKKEPPLSLESFPCVLIAEGQFPDAFKGENRPNWNKNPQQPGMPPTPDNDAPEPPPAPLKPKPGKLILIGNGLIFNNDIITFRRFASDIRKLTVNMVDYLSGADALISVRNKDIISRHIDKHDMTDGKILMWKIFDIGGFSLLFIAGGIGYYFLRKRKRRIYRESLNG